MFHLSNWQRLQIRKEPNFKECEETVLMQFSRQWNRCKPPGGPLGTQHHNTSKVKYVATAALLKLYSKDVTSQVYRDVQKEEHRSAAFACHGKQLTYSSM